MQQSGRQDGALGAVKAVALRWRFTVTLAAATALASIAMLVIWTRHDHMALALVDGAGLWFPLALLCGGVLTMTRWRFLDEPESAWLAAMLLLLAIYLRPDAYILFRPNESLIGLPDVGVIIACVWCLRSGLQRVAPVGWRHPLVVGLVGGIAFSGLRAAWMAISTEPSTAFVLAEFTLFLWGAVRCTWMMLQMDELPSEFRWQFTLPLALGLGCHHFLPVTTGALGPLELLSTAATLVSAIYLLSTTLALLQDAYQRQLTRVNELHDRVIDAESRLRYDEEMRHEARATVAGISNASSLLNSQRARLEGRQQELLRRMVTEEMERLQKLLSPPDDSATLGQQDVALDEVVANLVVSLEAQGMQIEHRPCGIRVHTNPDALATAVHVLLCNAQRHAPGARIRVWADLTHEHAVLHVSDDGPGVPCDLTDRLFTRGVKAPDSPGDGLGLYSAREAIRAHGGDLTTLPQSRGADFAITIPRAA